MASGDFAAASGTCSYPLVEVGIGRVDRYQDQAQAVQGLAATSGRPRSVQDVGAIQAGRDGAVVAATWEDTDGAPVQAVFVVGSVEEDWRIAGRSVIANPHSSA